MSSLNLKYKHLYIVSEVSSKGAFEDSDVIFVVGPDFGGHEILKVFKQRISEEKLEYFQSVTIEKAKWLFCRSPLN